MLAIAVVPRCGKELEVVAERLLRNISTFRRLAASVPTVVASSGLSGIESALWMKPWISQPAAAISNRVKSRGEEEQTPELSPDIKHGTKQ